MGDVVARLRAAGCVFAEDEARLIVSAAGSPSEVATLVDRRIAGLPLEHVVGWAEFGGMRIAVDPGVFVPRLRTEFLLQQAILLAPECPVILDMCCGAGGLGLAAASALPDVELHATDLEPAAVRCARRNLGAVGQVYEGDLYDPLPPSLRERIDVLMANVPYVPTGEIAFLPTEAREHEPGVALDGGADGLDVLRRVVAEAPGWLAPGGHLLIETSERQAEAAVGTFVAAGLSSWVATDDDGAATIVIGRRPHLT